MRNEPVFRWLVYLGCLFPLGVLAQNLVPNPGFEQYRNCPRHLGNFQEDVAIWTTPTLGSTDYFHLCSQHMGTPENFNGAQTTLDGKGYAGFYAYAPGDYREYLQVALKAPLREGKSYKLSFHVSLAERSDFAVRDFGVLFSNAPLSLKTKKPITRGKRYAIRENTYHYLEIKSDGFATDTSGWIRVETEFQARGSERYLILGNFRPNRETRTRATRRRSNKGAYYYLDQVELSENREKNLLADASRGAAKPGDFRLDSLQVFRSLLFEFDTFRLSGSGREELDSLFGFLESDPTLELHLGGHTDATGTPAYNQKLSERRCEAVASYLTELGIPADRIRYQGYGASQPVASNRTEAGRSRNRRVEFVIRKAGAAAAHPEQ
jgi:outer membrane protein OmpA-like peptidoglycan-associated protein